MLFQAVIRYTHLREQGSSPTEICRLSKQEGYKFPDQVTILRQVFDLSYEEARNVWVQTARHDSIGKRLHHSFDRFWAETR
jgi:hypothetical protein